MAIGGLNILVRSITVSEMVRAVRNSGADDRTKKELINDWFALREFESQRRLTRRQAVFALYGNDFGLSLRDQARHMIFERIDREILSPISRVRRNARHQAHRRVFGDNRLARLMG